MSLAHEGIGGVPISPGDAIVVAETPDQHCANSAQPEAAEAPIETRRDFLKLTTGAFAAVGVGVVAWPFIHSMNPARDTLAMSTIEVDLTPIAEGQAVTAMLRGKPIFVRHRTAAEIQTARTTPVSELKDPASDQGRVQRDAWLVLVGVCTHLGCVPLGQRAMDNRGDFGGWFCPCHGSHYDTSGRVRKGPAPTNLAVPTYTFMSPTQIRVG